MKKLSLLSIVLITLLVITGCQPSRNATAADIKVAYVYSYTNALVISNAQTYFELTSGSWTGSSGSAKLKEDYVVNSSNLNAINTRLVSYGYSSVSSVVLKSGATISSSGNIASYSGTLVVDGVNYNVSLDATRDSSGNYTYVYKVNGVIINLPT